MTSDYNEGVTVIDPLGDQSIYTIVDDFENGWRETQRLIYQSSSPLLETVQTEWGDSYGNTCYSTETPTGPCFPTQITTIWPNGKQKRVQKSYDQGGSGFRSFGDVISESEYDYGSGAPGALLRTTTYSYLALTNSTYAANNLFDLESQEAVFTGAAGSGACGSNGAVACTAYAYDGSPLASSGITTQHSSSPPAGTYRGNQTSVSHWLNTNNTLLTTAKTYFDTGTVDTVTDPLLNVTTYTYSNTFQGAYVTETQLPNTNVGGADKNAPNPTTHITQDWYDFNTGLKDWHEDENDQKTSYTYETMWRVATITPPSPEGVTQFTYTDTPGSLSIEQSQVINSTQSTNSYTLFDGQGRQISSVTANGETTPYDRSDTCYDARGWKSFASYPYQTGTWSTWSVCPSSVAGDTYAYDALKRITSITHSDSTVLTKSYTGAATSLTDEGNGTRGVQHILQVDGLARLKSVCEVTSGTLSVGTDKTPIACSQDIAGTGFLTTYGYDSLGDLLSVSQGSSLNPRTFTYDSLTRLITTTNPEAGTTCYGSWVSGSCVENYDANSNVLSRTRPAPNQSSSTTYVTATYAYDPLNRLTSKTYSDGTTPTATFDYDETGVNSNTLTNTTGRLSSEYTGPSNAVTSESILSYNAPGWTVEDIQCTPQNCANGTYLTFNYGYDGVGDVTSSGNGIIFTYALQYNVVPRLTQITTNWFSPTVSSGTVISGLHYNSFGKPVAASLNDSIVAETWSYDVRGRIKSDTALASSTTLYSLTNLTYSGNSDALTATDSVNGTWSNYTYDDFNRLISSTCSSACPQGVADVAFSYTYDRYGNRWQQMLTAGSGSWPQPSYSFDANNRISTSDGFTFDAAGNIINDTIHTYTYDAENRIVQVDAGSTAVYSYDAEGRRVAKTAASAGGAFEYLFDLQGRAVTELGAGTKNINRTEIYGGGRHLATQNVGLSTTYFAHNDWLGTERVRSSLSGTVAETCQSLPYGDVLNCSGAQASTLHFTGQMRDAETNLTEFPARYYSWTQGRFISPDWSPEPDNIPYADTEKPQSLDLYSYVGNNPLRKIDPDGHCCLAEEEATESGAEIGAEIGTLIEPGGGSAVGAFVGGAIGLGVAIYADYKFTHFMMAQHGKQNISNEYSNYTDDELDEAYKNAKSASEKEKIKAEQKSRQQRRSRQSGGKKPKAPTVKNDPASLRAKETPNTTKTTVTTPVPANPEKATVTTTHKETLPSPPPPPRD
jgi:RHS repeat-associated protein